jgi:hypothetical protein
MDLAPAASHRPIALPTRVETATPARMNVLQRSNEGENKLNVIFVSSFDERQGRKQRRTDTERDTIQDFFFKSRLIF